MVISKYRKAAVLIHGVSSKDQRWLLANLPENVSTCVRPLLRELRELGIPKDRMILQSALDTAKTIKQKRSLIMELNAFSSKSIYQCLGEEPLCLVRSILAIYQWSWGGEVKRFFSQNLDRQKTKYLLAAQNQKNLSEKSICTLLECFLEKMDDIPTGVVIFGGALEGSYHV